MTTFSFAGRNYSGASGGVDLGDGPVTVLIHGAGMDRTVWSLQTRWLAHHDVAALAIDLPGHGASAEPAPSSIEDHTGWVVELCEAIDRPIHLVGHSMGSFIALEAAVAAPQAATVSLIGTAAAMPVHPALLEAAEADDPLAAQLMSGWAFAPATRTGPHPSPGASMVGATQAMIGQSDSGVLHADLAMCARYESATATAGRVSIPASLLLGGADRMTPVRAAQPLIEALDDATVEIVPGVGHMIMIEAPNETRRHIAAMAATPAE